MSDENQDEKRTPQGPSAQAEAYWSANLKRLGILLLVWFVGSYGVSILFVDALDKITFFGFPLGFWFSQQGSIYVFMGLILVYVVMMNALDDKFENEQRKSSSDPNGGDK